MTPTDVNMTKEERSQKFKNMILSEANSMYQKLIIIGNLGKDPVMSYTPSGQSVTSFNVATNRKYKDNNGQSVEAETETEPEEMPF